jgi:hypothetical protein
MYADSATIRTHALPVIVSLGGSGRDGSVKLIGWQ